MGLGIESTPNIINLFQQLSLFKTNRKNSQSSFEAKRVRAHGYAAQQKNDIAQQRMEGPSYITNDQINKIVTRGHSKNKK